MEKRNKLMLLGLTLATTGVLAACSNATQSTNGSTSTASSSVESSNETSSSSSEATSKSSTSQSSTSESSTSAASTEELTKTMTLIDGTEVTYRYKTTIKPGDYSKMNSSGSQEVLVIVNEDGTFQINRPGVVVAHTNPDGTFTINGQVNVSEDGTLGDFTQLHEDGTYQIVAKNSTYGLYDDGSFAVNLPESREAGKDFDRYYKLLEENNLPTIEDSLNSLEEIIDYIETTFAQ